MKINRKIAIFADVHGLLEPLEAVLFDIQTRGIKEIYSLGDNIGIGPNPKEVIHLLKRNDVISIKGNSEEYATLGIEPFYYFDEKKRKSQEWTSSKLGEIERKIIEEYPHSIELNLGSKKIGLCHFANDVRFDFSKNNVFQYQENITLNNKAYQQFFYTNSKEQLEEIREKITKYGKDHPKMKGYLSALKDPLFQGKSVEYFDTIIQGHMHFRAYEHGEDIDFYTIRALAMAYGKNPLNKASYIILSEKETGFAIEEVFVTFDRERMENSILYSDIPDDTIKKYTGMMEMEESDYRYKNR